MMWRSVKYSKMSGIVLLLVMSLRFEVALGQENGHEFLPSDPIETDAGYVFGATIRYEGKAVRVYKGIPFAAPPVGDLRWKPPQPVEPWSGVRECNQVSLMAPQHYPASPLFQSVPEEGMGEDCLYLNVVTPATSKADRLPVMVWSHGGALAIGWSNMPANLSAPLPLQGVVVVSVNNRLGPIGYMAHPLLSAESEHGVSGNYGSLDLIAALEWVQRNIAAFGGDPDCVTIFGNSGGGTKSMFALASPLAEGLFHRIIVMSSGMGGLPLEEAEQLGVNLAHKLDIVEGPNALAELRARSWQDIINAAGDRTSGYKDTFTLDGWSLPDIAAKYDVPILVGYVGSEKGDSSPDRIAQSLWPCIGNLSTKYAYVFTHVPYGWGSKGVKAYHGGEVAYVLGVPDRMAEHYGNLFRGTVAQKAGPDPGLDWRDDWCGTDHYPDVGSFCRDR